MNCCPYASDSLMQHVDDCEVHCCYPQDHPLMPHSIGLSYEQCSDPAVQHQPSFHLAETIE